MFVDVFLLGKGDFQLGMFVYERVPGEIDSQTPFPGNETRRCVLSVGMSTLYE